MADTQSRIISTANLRKATLAQAGLMSERQVLVGGLRIACYDSQFQRAENHAGFLSSEPLILLHGLCSLSYTWHEVFEQLAACRRVVAIDLKGFGASDKPADNDYTIETQADIVASVMDELQIGRAVLAGNSLGGGIALRLAQRAPQLVSRLVLVNPAAYHLEFPWLAKIIFTAGRAVGDAASQQIIRRLANSPGFIESRIRHAHHRRETVTAERVTIYSAMLQQSDCQRAIVATLKSLDLRPVENNLRAVTQPALVIWGKYDRVLPLRSGERLARELPNAELQILPCGHAPQEELPVEFARVVNEYLSSTDFEKKVRPAVVAQ